MTGEEIKEKLTIIFREVFEDDAIVLKDAMVASDVENWDSLTNVLMLERVETDLGVKLKLKEIVNLQNVGDLIKCLEGHLIS